MHHFVELPAHYKTLYRHWGAHVRKGKGEGSLRTLCTHEELVSDLTYFITERMDIWDKKSRGLPTPYSEDRLFQKYRFCNVLREFDRQTIDIHTLLNPLRNDFPRWLLNIFYCRMIARPQTVYDVGLLSFDPHENATVLERLRTYPRPRYGVPYVFPVSVILKSQYPTREQFMTEYLPRVMPSVAEIILSFKKASVVSGVDDVLLVFQYHLHFLWTEVLIDVAYQFPDKIDLFKEFPIGPGALPTFRRIAPRDPILLGTQLAHVGYPSGITYLGQPIVLSAENWEGIGCEFRKYTNLKSGKGRKRLFHKT